jgi:hypothetical protein
VLSENPGRDLVYRVFFSVRQLVQSVRPDLGANHIGVCFCNEIRYQMRGKERRRAFMHVGHNPTSICVDHAAEKLSDEYLTGLFLHEFGHLATPEGSEQDADQWVFRKLGIVIEYRGNLCLEWARL